MAISLSDFTSHVKDWNMYIYGFLGIRKRQLLKSLFGIQTALEQTPSNQLIQLEMDTRDELENIISHEEML